MSDHTQSSTEAQEPVTGEAVVIDGAASQIEELQARIAQLERESADHKDQWLRATADYRNFKRRSDQERLDLIRSASAGLLLKLLPVMDDLERAQASIPAEFAENSWFGGFRLIPHKLKTIIESEGVTPIEAVGQPFDPEKHEAVIFEEGGDGQLVSAELQRGYLLREKVLRPTMVKVS